MSNKKYIFHKRWFTDIPAFDDLRYKINTYPIFGILWLTFTVKRFRLIQLKRKNRGVLKMQLKSIWNTNGNQPKQPSNNVYIYVLLAFVSNFIIEFFSQDGLSAAWDYLSQRPWNYIYNTALIFLTLQIVFLFKRRVFVSVMVLGVWILLGITNGIILNYRVTPFTYLDITLLKNAFSMLDSYFSSFQLTLLFLIILLLVVGFVVLFLFGPKRKGAIDYKKVITGIVCYTAAFTVVTGLLLHFQILAVHFGNIAYAYLDYGFPYCFTSTALNTGINQPFNYSQQSIRKLGLTQQSDSQAKTPNIIMIQLESFFDITHVTDLSFSQDPVLTFRNLKQQYSSGYLTVPSVGAGTANTEFEVLTGMSLDYFGTGEYPYKTILTKKTAESLGYNLKDLGYATHALHNNDATFYNRHEVFKQLGFDSFTAMEFMNITEYTPTGWAKDKFLIDEIIKAMDATPNQQDFVYAISVQGHGSYPNEQIDPDQKITVTGAPKQRQEAIEYYTNQIYEMDLFIAQLIERLSSFDEDVLLVLYGDHLPGLQFQNEDLDNYNIYQTEYVVWDNFGLEKQDKNLTTYQLSARIAELLDIHHGTMIQFHQTYQNKVYYQKNLHLLQYDMLYGKQYIYSGENPFQPTDMRYDVVDFQIDDAYVSRDHLYVVGDEFTQYSTLAINGHQKDTIYISPMLIKVEMANIQEGDTIQIQQENRNRNMVLAKSKKYVYHDDDVPTIVTQQDET